MTDHTQTEGPSVLSIIRDIRDCREFKGPVWQVMMAIASRVNWKKGYTAFPSYALLAEDTGLGISTAKKAVAKLKEHGWLHYKERPHRSNLYRLNLKKLKETAEVCRVEHQRRKDEAFGDHGDDDDSGSTATPKPVHVHITHAMLLGLRDTGTIKMSPEARRAFPNLTIDKECTGTMAGHQVCWDGIGNDYGLTVVPNPGNEGDCLDCLGSHYGCTTAQDPYGNTITAESDAPCPACCPDDHDTYRTANPDLTVQ